MAETNVEGGGLHRRLLWELRRLGVPWAPEPGPPVTEGDLDGLPPAAQRYLRFMRVVGRPRARSVRARFVGRFRLRRSWMPAEAWQYDSWPEISRVFVMRLSVGGVVPIIGVDAYLGGRGWMVGKLLNFITIVEERGPELDTGELVTYLNDAVLLAPSFLLRAEVSWREVDQHAFDVSLEDAGRSVSGRVFLDPRGAPRDFATTDRYADDPSGLVKMEWRTPVSTWGMIRGRPLPGRTSAEWHRPEGPAPYIEGRFDPAAIAYDVPP